MMMMDLWCIKGSPVSLDSKTAKCGRQSPHFSLLQDWKIELESIMTALRRESQRGQFRGKEEFSHELWLEGSGITLAFKGTVQNSFRRIAQLLAVHLSEWQKKNMESLHSKYTTVQKFQVSKIFNVSKSLLCSPRLHWYDQKYSKNCNIVRYFKMYSCDGKAFTWFFRNLLISCFSA